MALSASGKSAPRVCVIGAGFGGVSLAVGLHKAGIDDFVVYEKASGVGGVWHHNTYPGAEVDTRSHWYSLSVKYFDWPRTHGSQQTLESYINAIVDDYGVRNRFRFETAVTTVTWREQEQNYRVELSDGSVEIFDVVAAAVGLFNVPRYPDWPGMADFAGPIFHSARWEHEHDLAGKRVALVGSGSSAIQITTRLAETAGSLTLFQRSPGWILPKGDRDYTAEEREAFSKRSTYRRERIRLVIAEHRRFSGGSATTPGTKKNLGAKAAAEDYIRTALKDRPDLQVAVTPDHPYMGKRPIQASGFYEALLRDTVTLVPSAVTEVTPKGVIDSEGRLHECDAIVIATGFRATDYLGEIELFGRDGREIHEQWQGEPDAFLGLTVPNYPNFYMLYGPNTNAGSITSMLEVQSAFIVRDVRRLARSRSGALEVRPFFHRTYNRWIQRRLAKTAFAQADNYYTTPSGKLVVPFPLAWIYYWSMGRLLRRVSSRRIPPTTTEARS